MVNKNRPTIVKQKIITAKKNKNLKSFSHEALAIYNI